MPPATSGACMTYQPRPHGSGSPEHNAATPTKEAILLAIVAAILFLIALVFELASVTFGPLGALVFITAGLLCLALQFAGVGRSRL
jgi:hypothetical protein